MALEFFMWYSAVKINTVFTSIAFGAFLLAQATPTIPETHSTAIWVGIGSVISAMGTLILGGLKLLSDDRKDAREKVLTIEKDKLNTEIEKQRTEQKKLENDVQLIDLANKLNRALARLETLESIEKTADALKDRAEEVEERHIASQAEIAELRQIISELRKPVAENQQDLAKIPAQWNSPTPPKMKAATDPAPVPEVPPRSSGEMPIVEVK